ncbi:MAG: SprT-like domain-containing protein [Bacteriovoracaceae bacterium]
MIYPLQVVVFEHTKILGFFDPKFFVIGINKEFLWGTHKELLEAVLRHEIAHYLTFVKFQKSDEQHGRLFKEVCRSFSWGPEISKATTYDSPFFKESIKKREQTVKRLQKIKELTKSDNVHESQVAIAKLNQYIQKMSLDFRQETLIENTEENLYALTLWQGTKASTKIMAISEILSHNLVYPYFNYGTKSCHLEILGEQYNLEAAEFLFHYLFQEFEELWKRDSKKHNLKGLKQKNAYFRGLSKGHIDEIQRSASLGTSKAQSRELMELKGQLALKIEKLCPEIKPRSFRFQEDLRSRNVGGSSGKELNIRKGLKDKAKKLLSFGGNT